MTQHVLPKTRAQLVERFERDIPELEDDEKSYHVQQKSFREETIKKLCQSWSKSIYAFEKVDYSSVILFHVERCYP